MRKDREVSDDENDPFAERFAKEHFGKYGSVPAYNMKKCRVVGYDAKLLWVEWFDANPVPITAKNIDHWYAASLEPERTIRFLLPREEVSYPLWTIRRDEFFLDPTPEWPHRCQCGQPGIVLFVSFKCASSFCKLSKPKG